MPEAGLSLGGSGILYGTTAGGGGGTKCTNGTDGCGTIFKLTTKGKETALYVFSGGSDGALPFSPVIVDSTGNLYGATSSGGLGAGTVFQLAPNGTETVLYSFQGTTDGNRPTGNVVADQNGNIYGSTVWGGYTGSSCPFSAQGCGTIFKVATGGSETVLHAFQGGNDGTQPTGGVIIDGHGNLYGTTTEGGGGTNCVTGGQGCGTVFEVTSEGTETVLYAFQGGNDGAIPQSSLIEDSNGNLYGTTEEGGASSTGTVFKLAPNGTETVLYAFKSSGDGADPEAGLVMDQAGNLYGTTFDGGQNKICENGTGGCGTVFKITPDGKEILLFTFKGRRGGPTRGAFPRAPLCQIGRGLLYGTASEGGKDNDGVVFSVSTK